MLTPESVMLNLFQHLFRAGLIQHLIKSKTYETLKQPMKQVQGMVQGDKSGLFTGPSFLLFVFLTHLDPTFSNLVAEDFFTMRASP